MCKAILRTLKLSHFKTYLFSLLFLLTLQAQASKNSCEAVFEATPQEQLASFRQRFESRNQPHQKSVPPIANTYLLKKGMETTDYEADQLAFNPYGVSPAGKAHQVSGEVGSHFPYPEFLGDRLAFNNNSYRLINVGHRQQARDWPQIQNALLHGIDEVPGKNIILQMSKMWSYGRKVLKSWSTQASAEVVNVYRQRKPYLRKTDLYSLEWSDEAHKQNDDYFILLKDTQKSPLEFSKKDFQENVLLSIRLARMQANDPAFPFSLTGEFSVNDHLPVSHRDQFDAVREAKSILYNLQRRHGLKVAEISRFVRFGDVPPEVMNSFLTKLFVTAVDPKDPIDLLVISVDPITRTLFKGRYKFEDLVTIPGERETEYLMYLDTKSDVFKAMLAKLQTSESAVQKEKIVQAVPATQWQAPWGIEYYYAADGRLDVSKQGTNQVHRARRQAEQERSHVASTVSVLRNEKVTSSQRLEEVVQYALYQGVEQLDYAIRNLSAADQVKIFKNTHLFSNEWQSIAETLRRQAGSKKKILISGDRAPILKSILESPYRDQKFDTIDFDKSNFIEGQYDLVIVVDSLSKLSKEEQVRLLTSATKYVNKDGYLTLVEPYLWEGSPVLKRMNTLNRLLEYAHSMQRNEAPMNEFELAVTIRQVYASLRGAEKNQFRFADIDNILREQIGIIPETYSDPAPLLGFQKIDATRNPDNSGP